jgi:hypothetical protein
MAVYGVSPYAMPKEAAIGAMMNLRLAQAWKSIPQMMAISTAFGSKEAALEVRSAIMGPPQTPKAAVQSLMDELKMKEQTR